MSSEDGIDPQVLIKKLKQSKKKIKSLKEKIEKLRSDKKIWKKFEEKWYDNKEAFKRFLLIKEAITNLNICHSSKCTIFNPIGTLEIMIDDLDFKNLKEAEEKYGRFNPAYVSFKEQYESLLDRLIDLKEQVFRLYNINKTRRFEIAESVKRRNKFVELCAKHKIPYQTSMGGDADAVTLEEEETLMPYDPELTEEFGIFTKKKKAVPQNNRPRPQPT